MVAQQPVRQGRIVLTIVWTSFMRWLILDRHQVCYISADCQGRHDATSFASLLHVSRQDTAGRVVSTAWGSLPLSNERADRSGSADPMQARGIMMVRAPMSLRQPEGSCHHEENKINRRSRPSNGNGGLDMEHQLPTPFPRLHLLPVSLHRCCCITRMRGPWPLEPSVQAAGS